MVLVARQNTKNKYLVPSAANSFNGFNVERVVIDPGCNSNLIYLKDGDIERLIQHFPPQANYAWEICTHGGVGAKYLVLKICGAIRARFMTDVTSYTGEDGQEHPYPHPFEFRFHEINFHLSESDMAYLAQSSLDIHRKDRLSERHTRPTQARRDHALIGQSLLKDCACLQVHMGMLVMTEEAYNAGGHDIRQLMRVYAQHVPGLSDQMAEEDISIDESDRSVDQFMEET